MRKIVLAMIAVLLFCFCLPIGAQCLIPPPKNSAVTFYGPVTENSANALIEAIQIQNLVDSKDPIFLFIDSPGGDTDAMWQAVDTIENSRRPVYTVVVGKAASAAGVFWLYGTKRFMFPHSSILFHDGYVSVGGTGSKVFARMLMWMERDGDVEKRIAKITGMKVDFIALKESADWWLLPKEAIRIGLADAVVLPHLYPVAPPVFKLPGA